MKINGTEKDFSTDSGPPISLFRRTVMKKKRNVKDERRCQNISKSEVKLWEKVPVDIDYGIKKQKMQILINQKNYKTTARS